MSRAIHSPNSVTRAADKVSNSVARNRHDRPVSPPPSPSFLNRLWLSVRPGGLLTAKNQAQGVKRRLTVTRKTQKKPKDGPRRRVSSAPRPATGSDWADWCDVGRMTKDMPPDNALPCQRERMSFMRSRVITADACDNRPCDNRHASRGYSSRNVWLLFGRL